MLTYSFGLYCSCSDGRRVVHAYTTAATISGTVKSTDTYTYGNSAWKDQLTAYKGQTITYDAMGNPLSYRGKTMEWEQGRRLKKITGTNLTQTNSYDNDGIRTKKVVNGVTTEFYTSGSAILAQKSSDGTRLDFLYDDKGTLFAMEYAGERYFYQKNLQGDITGLIDSTGTEVVTYTYDTWGKLLSKTDGSGNGLAEKNPFRYRGYYYDAEVSLYYVSSRYYDPETGRILNADFADVLKVQRDLCDKNLYAYCDNNPIIRKDAGGEFWTIVSGAVMGAAISAGVELALQIVTTGKVDLINIGLAALGGAAGGALAATSFGWTGQIIGNAAISAVTEGISQVKNGNRDIKSIVINAGKMAVIGAASVAIGGKGIKAKGSAYKKSIDKLNSVKGNVTKAITNPKAYRHQINRAIKSHRVITRTAIKSTVKSFGLANLVSNIMGRFRSYFGW